MDDSAVFCDFLITHCGIAEGRHLNELLTFVDTFRGLLGTSDDEIDKFVKNTDSTNSARTINYRILIPTGTVIKMKSLLFELKDRECCGVLPSAVMLASIDGPQLDVMRIQRSSAIEDTKKKKGAALPTIVMPSILGPNFEAFLLKFRELATRMQGRYGIGLDYLMRTSDGQYNAVYSSRDEKLRHCARLIGPEFEADSILLYSLLVEHIGNEGPGSNIINRFKTTKNGYQCFKEFVKHYKNDAYLENKASSASQATWNAVYKGERRNFTLDTYCQNE